LCSRCFCHHPPVILKELPQRFSRRVVFSSAGDLNRVYEVTSPTRIWRDELGRAPNSAAPSLLAVLLPRECRICRSELTWVSSLPVCQDCLTWIVPLGCRLCSVCARDTNPVCERRCRAASRFRRAVAAAVYDAPSRHLLHLFKYQGVRLAATFLGHLLERGAAAGIKRWFLVVGLPLETGKRRARGFNHSEEIAWAISAVGDAWSIQPESELLIQNRETVSETGLTRCQRQSNLRGAFAVTKSEKLRGKNILVMDDVMITGAKAGKCARIMMNAGATEVFVATVRRAARDAENVLTRADGRFWGGTTGHA
jgi:ComF family protein